MQNGILLFYDDGSGEIEHAKKSEASAQERAVWCLPCKNSDQEHQLFVHIDKRANHRYLIDLSSNHSMALGLLRIYA